MNCSGGGGGVGDENDSFVGNILCGSPFDGGCACVHVESGGSGLCHVYSVAVVH